MPFSFSPDMMRQVILDHYQNPQNKREPKDGTYKSVHMHSSNCIDDIDVFLKFENEKVVDACFTGVGCAIATSSTDIMCDLFMNKSIKEVEYIIQQYLNMIYEKEFDDEVLDDAIVFINTSKQASRIRCATIGWNAAEQILNGDNK